jgi:glucose-1-phosphate adenylyltransferase
VLILSGDQLYRMDYREMIATHKQSKADVTISAVPVYPEAASGLGIMRLDESGRVVGFLEKPKTLKELEHIRTDPAWIDAHGVDSRGRDCLANMGIYLFNRNTLIDVLRKTDYRDFGKEVFPASIRSRHVQVHLFDGYWEDIGTIKSFFEANLELTRNHAPFDLISPGMPIFSRPRFLPPSRIDNATVRHSLIADGSQIGEGAVIEHSIIGLRCMIGRNVVIRDSIVMGNDFYDHPDAVAQNHSNGLPPMGIGEGSVIEGAIIDKNCRIGRNVRICNEKGVLDSPETQYGMFRDGIAVIPKETTLPDDWRCEA